MLARVIVSMMAGVIVMTLLMVLLTVLWTAEKNNESAAIDSNLMIGGGYEGVREALVALNWDYSGWTAALRATLIGLPKTWGPAQMAIALNCCKSRFPKMEPLWSGRRKRSTQRPSKP